MTAAVCFGRKLLIGTLVRTFGDGFGFKASRAAWASSAARIRRSTARKNQLTGLRRDGSREESEP